MILGGKAKAKAVGFKAKTKVKAEKFDLKAKTKI